MKKACILALFLVSTNSLFNKVNNHKNVKKNNKNTNKKDLNTLYNKLYNKPIKHMEEDQLRKFADVCIKLKYFDEAIKALEQLIIISKNLIIVKDARLEIADIYFEQGFFKIAGDKYSDFIKLYPVDSYFEYAQYKAILSYFECLPTNDRDQKMTEEVIEMANKLLEKEHPFKEDIKRIRDFCYRRLYEYHEGVFYYYCNKGSYQAAEKRLVQIKKIFKDVQLSNLDFLNLKLEYHLACNQNNLEKIKLLEDKLSLYPESNSIKFASLNKNKKSYVSFF